jgi:hypothetical protein
MSLSDLGYRLRDKITSLFNDDRKFVKLISRLGFLGLVAAIILIVAPTSADQNTPQAEMAPVEIVETTTAIVETITQTVDVIPVDTQSINMAETLTSLSVQETATPITTQPKFSIKIPSSLTVDPRANSKFVPLIAISGSEYVLVCISGNGLNIDVSDKRVNSDNAGDGVVVVGDMTSSLFISGATSVVGAMLNSANGLMFYSNTGGVANRSVKIDLVAMTQPGVKRSYCEAARTSATVSLRSMGLDMGTVKNGITLK